MSATGQSLFFAMLVLLLPVNTARAQTIIVDTSDDVLDFGGAQQVADLPGPDGKVSLVEAGLASDNTPGVQTIGFHIPQNEWLYQQFFPGRAVLKPFLGFRVFDTAILDGTTQTAFTGETNLDGGAEVVIWAETYLIDNVGGAMFGFDSSSIHLSGGSGNVIRSNTKTGIEVFDSDSNLIGGASPGEGNTGGFIQIDRASNNVIVGNTVQRVRVLGWIGNNQPAAYNRIGGPTPAERNYITGLGTWSSEGFPGGFAVQLFDSVGTLIENNSVGTTPDGLAQGHLATTSGIYIEGENHDVTIRGNRIAGILGHGIGPHYAGWLVGSAIVPYGTGSGLSIVGNTIGLDANGQPVLGSVTGISTTNYYLGPLQNVTIGGTAPGEGNEIAGHLGAGISVANTFAGVRISGNSIHDNGGLGIDLITDGFLTGVTPNDPLDLDTGGNDLQNFPVLQLATSSGAALRVVGTLNSTPTSGFRIELFASPESDDSGFGEGQEFLGSATVVTDSGGDASFDVTLPVTVSQGWVVASTATSLASGSTSEFSASIPTEADPGPGTRFCFGVSCPCGNDSLSAGCLNSSSAGALLSGSGTTSVAADDLVLVATDCPPNNTGLFFMGSSTFSGVLVGDGLSCTGGLFRYFPSVVDASGVFSLSGVVANAPAGMIQAGDTRHFQAWTRDVLCGPPPAPCPSPCGAHSNLSSGYSVVFTP